jgi:hypothetical protein
MELCGWYFSIMPLITSTESFSNTKASENTRLVKTAHLSRVLPKSKHRVIMFYKDERFRMFFASMQVDFRIHSPLWRNKAVDLCNCPALEINEKNYEGA